ncbi:MAG: pseudouridine synthase [Pirellulaceae bacterium]
MAKRKKSSRGASRADGHEPETVRLQRFLAQAGLGSRRECEELIAEGRVTIDGKVVQTMGVRVDAEKQKVLLDGTRVKPTRLQYFMVNKPPGVLSTCSDPAGRMRVIDLINTDQRVYNVGRLDKSSEGLILVTNDGDLANRLTHPSYGVKKTYLATVAGNPRLADLQLLKRGIRLAEAVARVAEVRIKKRRRDSCDLIIVLEEGRNREIRRLLAHIGHKVTRLRRIAIGPLQLGELPPGHNRRLEYAEIVALKQASSRQRRARVSRHQPVESSQLTRRKKKSSGKTVTRKKARTGAFAGGRSGKKKTTRKKKSTGKKPVASSRRGAGRTASSKRKKATSRPGKKKTARRGSSGTGRKRRS